MFDYVQKGTWVGGEKVLIPPSEDWVNPDPPPYNWMAGVAPKVMYNSWKATPAVDRSKVKIHRLDYFGHSSGMPDPSTDPDYLFLQYGWTNAKGETPGGEVLVKHTD